MLPKNLTHRVCRATRVRRSIICASLIVEPTDDCGVPLLDDGVNVVQVCTTDAWWRPGAMNVVTDTGSRSGHYLVLSRRVSGEASWPQFLVLCADAHLRLNSHPRQGTMGSQHGRFAESHPSFV